MRPSRHHFLAALLAVGLTVGCSATPGSAPPAPATDSPATSTQPPGSSIPDDALGGRPPGAALASPAPPSVPPGAPPSSGPSSAPAEATPTVRPDPTDDLPPAEPFAVDLYEPGDFVAQYTFDWCVGASIQMTLALTDTSHDTSRARQQELWERARDLSNSPFGGANPNGWVPTLNELGVGPYVLVSEPTLERAVRRAALALRQTDRPVGLVMWRGRHAWVMSGFESLGDPGERSDFRVTGVRVLDPLHPHGSDVWGPSPRPNALISLDVLGRQFVARTGGRINLGVPPGYLLVLPVDEA